jgi:two-component system CheB/CheR fusion protein
MLSKRVLIVEDNIDGARSLAKVLRLAGHEAEYAINGYVAVDMARKLLPEVIFLDIGLPGMNGYDVCQRLKREPALEKTLIVAVTGYGTKEDEERARAAGCHMHLVKPVDLHKLLALVAES